MEQKVGRFEMKVMQEKKTHIMGFFVAIGVFSECIPQFKHPSINDSLVVLVVVFKNGTYSPVQNPTNP